MKDWLGQEYIVGDYVLYSAAHGNHGSNMTLGKVTRIGDKTVSVVPLRSARYGKMSRSIFIDERTWDKIKPYTNNNNNWQNPDIWVNHLSSLYDPVNPKKLQPYITTRTIQSSPVVLKVTVNITKYNGPLPEGTLV